jgi:ubiquinone/menaquinone biosynthesis C-methylase UbiE
MNVDAKTVEGFGEEWSRFDQTGISDIELRKQFDRYFQIFPWEALPKEAVGFDMGCGSGRWAKLVADKAAKLYCIDASSAALKVAANNLVGHKNVEFICTSVETLPFEDDSMDFGYSLGVLHHVPDTAEGIKSCVRKLKQHAPFLVYLYYAFDNRPFWFRWIWRVSDVFRQLICLLPFSIKKIVTDLIAIFIYFPLARLSNILERIGFDVDYLPLSVYRFHSFYTMRTDALDRFGTKLEQRFTQAQIKQMMDEAGLEKIEFSNSFPFWCAVGLKK